MSDNKISIEQLRKAIKYDAKSGILHWLARSDADFPDRSANRRFNVAFSGCEALGSTNGHGYKSGTLLGKTYAAHIVCYALHHGKWPARQIDHINGDRTDNRSANLREVSPRENNRNKKLSAANNSGVNGVCWESGRNKWRARITVGGKNIYLGLFSCIGEAIAARREADEKYGFHESHGKRLA